MLSKDGLLITLDREHSQTFRFCPKHILLIWLRQGDLKSAWVVMRLADRGKELREGRGHHVMYISQ